MSEYGGLLFLMLDPKRAERISYHLEAGRPFTAAASAPDSELAELEVCLLSFDREHLQAFCLVRRRRLVATAEHRMLFQETVRLQDLALSQLEPISSDTRTFLNRATNQNITRASSTVWDELVRRIKELRPACAKAIDELDRLRGEQDIVREGEAFVTMAQEKDACGIALDIFGLKRTEYLPIKEISPEPAPFIRNLKSVNLREDTIIGHDAHKFPGWQKLKGYQVGAVEFEKNGERLTILNVNRTPIERTLGVDLIYYQHRFDSYVMVQYKRMLRPLKGEWCFRPTEEQCRIELKRMQRFKKQFPSVRAAAVLSEYRLNPEAFFFKLCREVTLEPLSDELIKGMYLPLDYWEILLESPATKGHKGGRIFHYRNVGRYLNNTEFVILAQQGWIGSHGQNSKVLTALIETSLAESHSVVLGLDSRR